MTYAIILIVIVVFAAGLALALRGRGGSDGVDSFRRQIDALSPEARKPTVDQVKSAEQREGSDGDDADSSGVDS